jgi:hypothetical protein
LLSFSNENGRWRAGDSGVVRSMLGDGESGLRYSSSSGAALTAAVMMGGPPPSNDSMQVVSIPWVDGASLGGNGSSSWSAYKEMPWRGLYRGFLLCGAKILG